MLSLAADIAQKTLQLIQHHALPPGCVPHLVAYLLMGQSDLLRNARHQRFQEIFLGYIF